MSTGFKPREIWDGEALYICDKCGAFVADMPLHHVWHEMQAASSAPEASS